MYIAVVGASSISTDIIVIFYALVGRAGGADGGRLCECLRFECILSPGESR